MTENELDKKINSFMDKPKKCNCDVYCPVILNGPCRFCYTYK